MTTFTATLLDRPYDPQEGVHPICQFNLFEPAGPMPFGGWPVIAFINLAGYTTSSKATEITELQAPLYALLKAGFALAYGTAPVARGGDAPNGVGPEAFDPSTGLFGDPYPNNGCLHTAIGTAVTWPGTALPGYVGTHPWLDDDVLIPEKAALWFVQNLKWHSQQGTKELPIDREYVMAFGTSAAAGSLAYAVWGYDRADAGGVGQATMSTRVRAADLSQCPVLWTAFAQDGSGTFKAHHFPAKNPSGSDPWQYDTPVATLQETVGQMELVMSPATYAVDDANYPGLTALNDAVPVRMAYTEAMSATIKADADRYKKAYPIGSEVTPHPAYFGYLAKQLLPNGVRLVIGTDEAVDAGADVLAAGNPFTPEDAVILDSEDRTVDLVQFFLDVGGKPVQSVEEMVTRALEDALRTVTTANGYYTNVGRVQRFEQFPSQMPYKAIAMVNPLGSRVSENSNGITVKTMRVELYLAVKGWKDKDLRVSNFLADVEKALYADIYLGGLSEYLEVLDNERFLDDLTSRNFAGAVVAVDVRYRHTQFDPYTPNTVS